MKLPTPVNTEGATLRVLATEDLADWTHAVAVPFDIDTGLYRPEADPAPPKMFFKYRISITND